MKALTEKGFRAMYAGNTHRDRFGNICCSESVGYSTREKMRHGFPLQAVVSGEALRKAANDAPSESICDTD
ncbi:MAG TPA: hypothetical protein VFG29_13360 [Syntrophales bacterium]|nr:hypothetical protein [Syntrophales bacterium]